MSDSTLREIAEFLDGSAPLEGVWFGEPHPTERGAFWWRSRLTAALAADDAARGTMPPALSEAEVKHIVRTTPGPQGFQAALVRAGWDAAMTAVEAPRAAAPQSVEPPAPTDAEWQEEALRLAREWCLSWGEWAHDNDPDCVKENAAEAALRAHLSTRPQAEERVLPGPTAADVIKSLLEDIEVCYAESGAEWKPSEISQETLDAALEYQSERVARRLPLDASHGADFATPTAPTDAEWQEEHMRLAYNYATAWPGHARDREEAKLRAHIATRPDEWIACSERLPKVHEALLLTTSGVQIIGDWYEGSWRTHRSKWEGKKLVSAYRPEDITHWRPLPAPPTKKEQP